MTLTQILADIYRRTGFASSPPTDVSTRITAFVNETQQEILREAGMQFLQNETGTFGSVANTQTYAIAFALDKIKTIRDSTNSITLDPMSLEEYRMRYPDPAANSGLSTRWVDMGFSAVHTQPSDASTVLVDSTSASDTGTAYIEGVVSDGTPFAASVTMTGTTAVAFTASTWVNITKFYISTAAVGVVTLHEDAEGGTELARLQTGQTHSRYRKIALVPTPSSAVTYSVDYERNVQDMVNGTDQSVLPEKFHYLLSIGARMKEYEKINDISRWTLTKNEYEQGLRKLKFWIYSQSVGSPNMRGFAYTRPDLHNGGTLAQAGGTSSPLSAGEGGTGFATYTIGDLLAADTTTSLSKLSAGLTGLVLKSTGAGSIPAWANQTTVITSTSTGAQNNWNPGIVGGITYVEWSGLSAIAVTGIESGSATQAGRVVIFRNLSAVNATFAHNSGSSDADNRLFNTVTSAATPVGVGGYIMYVHDGSNWVLIGHEQGKWIGVSLTFNDNAYSGDGTDGNWTVAAGDITTMKYYLSGRSLTVAAHIQTTSVVNTPAQLRIANTQWGDFTITSTSLTGAAAVNAGGAIEATYLISPASATYIAFAQYDAGTWSNATDTTEVYGTHTFEVT